MGLRHAHRLAAEQLHLAHTARVKIAAERAGRVIGGVGQPGQMPLHLIVGQLHALGGGNAHGFFHQGPVVSGQLGPVLHRPNGHAPAGGDHIVGAVQHIFAPDGGLHIGGKAAVDVRRLQGLAHGLCIGLVGPLAPAQIDGGVVAVLGDGVVRPGAGHHVDHALEHPPLAQQLAQLGGGVHPVHHGQNQSVRPHNGGQLRGRGFQLGVLHAHQNQVLHAQLGRVRRNGGGLHGVLAV